MNKINPTDKFIVKCEKCKMTYTTNLRYNTRACIFCRIKLEPYEVNLQDRPSQNGLKWVRGRLE